MESTRARLRQLLTERYVPLLLAAGFEGPPRITGNKLFHDYARKSDQGTHNLSIQFDKWQRPRFVINLHVLPPGGIDEVVTRGEELINARLKPGRGATAGSWFRADPPWWRRLLAPRSPTREEEAVEACVRLFPEVEAWWASQAPSGHIACWPARYMAHPGNGSPRGGSRAPS